MFSLLDIEIGSVLKMKLISLLNNCLSRSYLTEKERFEIESETGIEESKIMWGVKMTEGGWKWVSSQVEVKTDTVIINSISIRKSFVTVKT